MPAPGPVSLVAIPPSALPPSDGPGRVTVRPLTDVVGVALVDARADAEAAGPAEVVARTVERALCVWLGAGDGLLDVAGFPEPTTIVPVIVGWMEQ